MIIRSTFSLAIADRIKAGRTVHDAIQDVIGGITDGSRPRTTDILADLESLGTWKPG